MHAATQSRASRSWPITPKPKTLSAATLPQPLTVLLLRPVNGDADIGNPCERAHQLVEQFVVSATAA